MSARVRAGGAGRLGRRGRVCSSLVNALLQTGPLGRVLLLYSEETEFAAAGGRSRLVAEGTSRGSVVEHIGGDSDTNPMLAALLTVNRVRLFPAPAGLRGGAGVLHRR